MLMQRPSTASTQDALISQPRLGLPLSTSPIISLNLHHPPWHWHNPSMSATHLELGLYSVLDTRYFEYSSTINRRHEPSVNHANSPALNITTSKTRRETRCGEIDTNQSYKRAVAVETDWVVSTRNISNTRRSSPCTSIPPVIAVQQASTERRPSNWLMITTLGASLQHLHSDDADDHNNNNLRPVWTSVFLTLVVVQPNWHASTNMSVCPRVLDTKQRSRHNVT